MVIAGATRSITSRKVRNELINSVSSAYSISGGQHRCRLVDVVEGVSVDIAQCLLQILGEQHRTEAVSLLHANNGSRKHVAVAR